MRTSAASGVRLGLPVLALGLFGACEQERAGQALALKEGLAAAEKARELAPLTAETADSREEVSAVLRRPLARAAPKLGGIRQDLETLFVIEAGGEREVSLSEKVTLRLDARGQYAMRLENTAWSREDHEGQDGRACWWVGGRFFTAHRFGPATEVPIRAYEQERCLESAVEPFVGLLRQLAPHAAFVPGPFVQVGPRKALKVTIARVEVVIEDPPPVPTAWPTDPEAATRESPALFGPRDFLVHLHTRPRALGGEVLLDVETGAPLSGELTGELVLRKAGREATLSFKARLAASPLDGDVTPPEVSRPYIPRQRIFEERKALLGEVFKKREMIQLPKPGDEPKLRVGPDEESGAADGGVGEPPPPSEVVPDDEGAPP